MPSFSRGEICGPETHTSTEESFVEQPIFEDRVEKKMQEEGTTFREAEDVEDDYP